MKNIKMILKVFLCFFLLIGAHGASVANAEKIEDLKVDKYINDFANIIEDNTESELENKLRAFFASTTHQLVIITVNNMDGDYLENYTIKLAEKIKVGSEKNDNGVILFIAKDERKVRIEVGKGLESVLTDAKSSNIIRNIITPEFKKGDYTTGIKNGAQEIINVTSDENYVASGDNKNTNLFLKILSKFPPEIFLVIIFFGFGAMQWVISILGRTKSWWLGGVIGFAISIFIYFLLFSSLFIFLITILGFIFDYFISKNYKEHAEKLKDGPPDWWAGGSTFGGGGGWNNSSGGGFSGGGGSFGGGGASGSW